MKFLATLSQWASTIMMAIGMIALFLLMMHVAADVAGKYIFQSPIVGTLEIVAHYYMVAVCFLPIAYVQLNRQHLAVDLFTMKLSVRMAALLDAVVAILGVGYTGLLTYLVIEKAVDATAINEFVELPRSELLIWPARWVLPAGFGIMTAILFLQSLNDIFFAVTGRGEPTLARKGEDAAVT